MNTMTRSKSAVLSPDPEEGQRLEQIFEAVAIQRKILLSSPFWLIKQREKVSAYPRATQRQNLE